MQIVANKKVEKLMEVGRYAEAAGLIEIAFQSAGAVDDEDILLYGRCLMTLGKYAEAFNVVLLAMTGRETSARAYALQAEVRWLERRHAEAYNLSLKALELNMFNSRVQTIRNRCAAELSPNGTVVTVPGCTNSRRLGHCAFFVAPGGNFGDLALPPTIRATVGHWRPVSTWHPFHVHQRFDDDCVAAANQLDGLVIGGGGLFLPDTSPNVDSGWQWNISNKRLRRISVPIHVMAVGYNLFAGQSFTGGTFARSLSLLVEHAATIGLRNRGSIEQVRALLPDRLAERISYMPCPTTILSRLGIIPEEPIDSTARQRVFINAAFDRSERRFGDGYPVFLDAMARYVTTLLADGISVEYAAHLPRDEKLADDLAANYGLRLPVHGLYDLSPEDGYRLYRQAGVVVGMRGHATMIPFGLGVPVLSIVSHPKMRYFLEDIDRPDWGVEADAPDLADSLYRKTVAALDNNEVRRHDIAILQDSLYRHIADAIEKML